MTQTTAPAHTDTDTDTDTDRDPKVATSTMTLTTRDLAALRANGAVQVEQPAGSPVGTARWGVVVTVVEPRPRRGGGEYTVKVDLCETEDYARSTLAPFHAFYTNTARVDVVRIVDGMSLVKP